MTTNNLEEFGTKLPEHTAKSNQIMIPDAILYAAPEEINVANGSAQTPTQWTEPVSGMFLSTPETIKKLPSNVYKYVAYSDNKWGFLKVNINVDELLLLPDSTSDLVLQEIQTFLDNAETFKYYDVLHRRGFLFYGPAGSGKTCLVQQIIKKVIDQNGVILLCDNPQAIELGLRDLRAVEPDRFIVCLFEDIDALIQRYGEKEILAILDGESQINKVLNIGTTNYPEVLDRRIIRPRRFDMVIKIDWPSEAVRRHYFKNKLKIDDKELGKWVNATDKFSFAACAELMISVKCLGKDFEKAVEHLRELMKHKPDSRDFNSPADFNIGH